ncbi:MAG: LacI family DNA-binding transcriptional regulator [Sphaerochaetaceae bacterium]|jgi:LacI family transcriptional regulator
MRKKATIKDVAKMANVSTATVSHVLNKTKNVKRATEVRVMQAVKELNYIPNTMAKHLKRDHTHLVGLLISDIANPFFPPVVRGIEDYLASQGYQLILSETNGTLENEKQHLQTLLERRIDALIVSLATSEERHFENLDLPLVFFNRIPVSNKFNKVGFKSFDAAYNVAKHFLDHGYENISIIVGPQTISTGRDRLLGFKEAIKERNKELEEKYLQIRDFSIEAGFEGMKYLMHLDVPPRAVFASNYAITLGALKYLKENNHKIPTEIAFIGYDDAPWTPLADPPLTLISYPLSEMGKEIGKMVVELIRAEDTPVAKTLQFEGELVVRKSCGC